jgi:hypothetical protein
VEASDAAVSEDVGLRILEEDSRVRGLTRSEECVQGAGLSIVIDLYVTPTEVACGVMGRSVLALILDVGRREFPYA